MYTMLLILDFSVALNLNFVILTQIIKGMFPKYYLVKPKLSEEFGRPIITVIVIPLNF